MSRRKTSKATTSVTSSPESVDGHEHSDLQTGTTLDLFGLEAVPASPSARPAKKPANQMSGTFGRIGQGSSASQDLQRSLENKLRQRLPLAGGMMWPMIWKRKVTPARRQYCQLAVLVRGINATAFGLWATPTTLDHMGNRSAEGMMRQFSTSRKGRTAPANLREQVNPAMYPVALWQTPVADDAVARAKGKFNSRGEPKLSAQVAMNGLTAAMENQELLNPEFVCWLMGYTIEWGNCADMVTLSSPNSPLNS